MAREQLKTLTEPMYYILLSLLKENHGYGIMQMVSGLTEGRVVIGAGTLYSLLNRFESEGIIRQVAEENRRKIYKITELGGRLLKEEYTRLNLLVEDGRKFFSFEGERKTPSGGGGGEREEESRAKAEAAELSGGKSSGKSRGKELSPPDRETDYQKEPERGTTAEKEKKPGERKTGRLEIPQGEWNYGGV